VNYKRVIDLGKAIALIGAKRLGEFDLREPEYRAMAELHRRDVDPRLLALISLLAAVNDYRLPKGGATGYWSDLKRFVEEELKNAHEDELETAKRIIFRFLNESRHVGPRRNKVRRAEKLFKSGFCEWFLKGYPQIMDSQCGLLEIWLRLSIDLESSLFSKTVVFPLKVLDLLSLITRGRYLRIPPLVPIPLDIHIERMAISSGVVEFDEHDGEECGQAIRRAWTEVLRAVNEQLGDEGPVSIFRIDSLIWQAGREAYRCSYERKCSTYAIKRLLEGIGMGQEAEYVAEELTKYIDRVL